MPFPQVGPSTLLIRTTHVCPTYVDLLYCRGLHQNNRRHAKPPFVLGMEFAGVVLESPSWCAFESGDRVYGSHFNGAFAEYIAIDTTLPGALEGVRRLPAGWILSEACAVGASAVISLGSLYRAGLSRQVIGQKANRGDDAETWVLVTGATGGLGVMAVQIAKNWGAKVIALSSSSSEKSNVLQKLGIDVVVHYDQPGWEDEVKRVSDGEGVHFIFDGVGMVESALRCCRYGGTVAIVGFAGRDNDTIERLPMNRILLKSATVVGYRFGEFSRRNPEAAAQLWQEVDAMAADQKIKPVIYHRRYRGMGDISKAMIDMAEHKVYGRAVVEIARADESDGKTDARVKL